MRTDSKNAICFVFIVDRKKLADFRQKTVLLY